MAGPVPAIHVSQNFRTTGGDKVREIVVMSANWADSFDTIGQ
jgi:hypothetical protein